MPDAVSHPRRTAADQARRAALASAAAGDGPEWHDPSPVTPPPAVRVRCTTCWAPGLMTQAELDAHQCTPAARPPWPGPNPEEGR